MITLWDNPSPMRTPPGAFKKVWGPHPFGRGPRGPGSASPADPGSPPTLDFCFDPRDPDTKDKIYPRIAGEERPTDQNAGREGPLFAATPRATKKGAHPPNKGTHEVGGFSPGFWPPSMMRQLPRG